MKNPIIALLVTTLLVVLVNLLATLGFLGGAGGGGYEYKVLSAPQMDAIGFRSLAAEEGLEISEEGEINFPQEMADKLMKVNLLPRELVEVEKDGGWEFVAVTADNHYIFRRGK